LGWQKVKVRHRTRSLTTITRCALRGERERNLRRRTEVIATRRKRTCSDKKRFRARERRQGS